MRNPEQNESNEDSIKVTIGRFGSTPQEFTLPKDTSVGSALETAEITFDEGHVFVNGQRANQDNLLDDNDVVNVTTSKQGGSQ